MASKSSFRASCLSDARDFHAIMQRRSPILSEPAPPLDEGLERIKANIFLSQERPSGISTEDLVLRLSEVSQCLQSFTNSFAQSPQILIGTIRHIEFFNALYAFIRFLIADGQCHGLFENNAEFVYSFFISVACFQNTFARDFILTNPLSKGSFLLSAQSFLSTLSSVLCNFSLTMNQPIDVHDIVDGKAGSLEMAHTLIEHMLTASSAFSLYDSVSMQPQFFQLLNQLLVHITPLWSAESLGCIHLWCQSRQPMMAGSSAQDVHLAGTFPYAFFSSLLRLALFLYSRRIVELNPANIRLTLSIVCDLLTQLLNTIQSLRNWAAEAVLSAKITHGTIFSTLSPATFLEDTKLFSLFNRISLWCIRLLDCLISQIFKPDGFSTYICSGLDNGEPPKIGDISKADTDIFTEAFFQHNGWAILMQILHYTSDGILDDHIEPPVAELLSQITHCADMSWIKESGYLGSGFSTRLAYILVKSHSRNAKLAVFYTLCNIIIDQGYELVAVEHVISACIKNFKSTLIAVVYEANRLLVLLLQIGKAEDRDVYKTVLLHMINQKITSKLIKSFLMTAQSAQMHQTLPKELRKLASMQLKLFLELIECGKEYEEFTTPIYETKDELSVAIEEIDVRGPESLSTSCRELIDFIYS